MEDALGLGSRQSQRRLEYRPDAVGRTPDACCFDLGETLVSARGGRETTSLPADSDRSEARRRSRPREQCAGSARARRPAPREPGPPARHQRAHVPRGVVRRRTATGSGRSVVRRIGARGSEREASGRASAGLPAHAPRPGSRSHDEGSGTPTPPRPPKPSCPSPRRAAERMSRRAPRTGRREARARAPRRSRRLLPTRASGHRTPTDRHDVRPCALL